MWLSLLTGRRTVEKSAGITVVVFWNLEKICTNLSKLSSFLLLLIIGIVFHIRCLAEVHSTSRRQGAFSFCQEPH